MAVKVMTQPRPSRLQKMWKSMSIVFESRVATVGMTIVLFWVILAFISLFWTPYNPNASEFIQNQGPSAQNWLGTDHLGRDILSRLMQGTQVILLKTRLPGDTGVSIPGGVGRSIRPQCWISRRLVGSSHHAGTGCVDRFPAHRTLPGCDRCTWTGRPSGHPGYNYYRRTGRRPTGS